MGSIGRLNMLKTILIFQVGVWCLIFVDEAVGIPILRQLFCLIYIIFIPGLIFVFALKIKNSVTEVFLYSVGLSISFLMFSGFMINLVFPFFGLRPITIESLVAVFSILIMLLLFVLHDRLHNLPSFEIQWNVEYVVVYFLLLLILLLSIFGAYLMNFYDINSLL